MRRIALALAAMLVGPAARAADAPSGGWNVLADCAAAYRANAAMSDPDRPASMTSMISGQAKDYEEAAVKAFQRQRRASELGARQTVQSRIQLKVQSFTSQPRAEIERFIDACPQVDG